MTRSTKTRIIAYSAIAGLFLGAAFDPVRLGGQSTPVEQPLPHHFPKYKGNRTLRFAAVHDVIHERFTRRGPAYYAERNRLVQEALKKAQPDSDEYFKLVDDLAVGLLWTGKPTEAIDLMRDKLKRQQAAGKQGKDLYTTYANLGTFLILFQFQQGLQKPEAKERIGESIELVKKAIEVNPESHFGREQWQVVLEQFLLAVIDKPELLLKYDMIGDRRDLPLTPGRRTAMKKPENWARSLRRGVSDPFTELGRHIGRDDAGKAADDDWRRHHITDVGAEPDWAKDVGDISKPTPFDEPTLGIIGMWTMGAGANPYFAAALGEIMLRVGQRYIAWSAFERAALTADGIWPDPDIHRKFISQCRDRQKFIEQQLPLEERAKLRDRFNQELKHGQAYQQAYQDYERQQIEKGKSIDDPRFYDDFVKERGQIASPVGNEDKLYDVRTTAHHVPLPSMLLAAGVLAFAAAVFVFFFPTTPTPSDVFEDPAPAAKNEPPPVGEKASEAMAAEQPAPEQAPTPPPEQADPKPES